MAGAGPPPVVDALDPQPSADRPPLRRRLLRRVPRPVRVAVVVVAALVALTVWRTAHTGPAPLTRADVDRAVRRGLEQVQQQQSNGPARRTP